MSSAAGAGRKLDVERYQRVKNQNHHRTLTPTNKTPTSTLTPTSTKKTVMTWKELESTLGNSQMKNKRAETTSSNLFSPKTPSRRTPARASASPLTLSIRQQILKSDEVVSTPMRTTTAATSTATTPYSIPRTPAVSERRQRLEKHQHRLLHRSSSTTSSSPAVTPLRVRTTPLRSTTSTNSTSTLRVVSSTTKTTTPVATASFVSPRPTAISTTNEKKTKASLTPIRQPSPPPPLRTPLSNSSSVLKKKSTSTSRPTPNKTLTTPPVLKKTSTTTSTSRPTPNKTLTPRAVPPKSAVKRTVMTPPRTPLRAVPNSTTPIRSKSVLKDDSSSSSRKSPSFATSPGNNGTSLLSPKNEDTTAGSGTRRNLDKRSARLRYSDDFLREITKLRQEQLSMSTLPSSAADSTGTTTVSTPTTDGGVLVFVRKRPIFRNELQRGDFDVVATTTTSATAALSSSLDASTAATVVVYRTQMHADMKTKQVQPVAFGCTAAFDEKVSSEEVYRRAAMPLVQETKGGGVATLLMFGQTGSGKTYTMTAIEEHCATGIFDDTTTTTTAKGKITVQVQYLELCGKICRDLVDDARPEVRIMDKEDGSVCFVNAASVVVETAEELFSVIAKAKQRRATQATDRNDESSRSHAVCQMTIYNEGSHAAAQKQQQQRGVLTLVDCAGTERRNDSMYHSRSRQAESVEINASLYALKECIRARSSRTKERHVPYRSNNLTRVLRESLERQDARLAVIATVGPNATDTEHTIETLKTVSSLGGVSLEEGRLQKVSASPSSSKLIAPKRWDHQELVEWLSGKRLVGKAVAGHVDGRLVMRMSKIQLRNTFYEDDDMDKAEVLFRCLRAETDRVARLDLKRRIATSKTN